MGQANTSLKLGSPKGKVSSRNFVDKEEGHAKQTMYGDYERMHSLHKMQKFQRHKYCINEGPMGEYVGMAYRLFPSWHSLQQLWLS